MALTRKLLSALGIEADKVEQIIEAHTETVDGLKQQIAQYKSDAEKLPEVQKQLDEDPKGIRRIQSPGGSRQSKGRKEKRP